MAARQQLIDALFDYDAPKSLKQSLHTCSSDDDVRIKVIDLLEGRVQRGDERFEIVVNGLVSVLKDPMSGRITRRSAISRIVECGPEQASERTGSFMPDGYTLGTNGRVTKG